MDWLSTSGQCGIYNCGYGRGYSVKEVVNMVRSVSGATLPIEEVGRRGGDPPSLVADASLLRYELNWAPDYDDLATIVKHAYDWEGYCNAL
jgi:UDP-glucose 4-epimerase